MTSPAKGFAFMLMIIVLATLTTVLLLSRFSLNQHKTLLSQASLQQLNHARDALLGFALGQDPPGRLPCPDTDGDGDGDSNVLAGTCASPRGLLPHRTLGLDDLRDSSGSKLWYSLDPAYSRALPPFNSRTPSQLTLIQPAQPDTALAFAIIAPNSALSHQLRPQGTWQAAHYLEGLNGDANPYSVTFDHSSTHNDQLLGITLETFWALMADRLILPQALASLNAYHSLCADYPWAAPFASAPFNSQVGLQQGSLPVDAPINASATPCSATLTGPSWLASHWAGLLQYHLCQTAQGLCLSITGDVSRSAQVALIAPGPLLNGQLLNQPDLSHYFEGDNQDGLSPLEYRTRNHLSASFNDVLHHYP